MTKPDVTAGEEVDKPTQMDKWMKILKTVFISLEIALCIVLIIYMPVLFILLLGWSWLALALTVIAAGYWIYLVFVTRLKFMDYIAALVEPLFLVFVAVKTSKHRCRLKLIFVVVLFLIIFVLASVQESLHSPWVLILAVGGLLYVLFLLIPQLYHSWELSKPVYSALIADLFEKRFETLPYHLAKSAARGFKAGVALAKGEPKSVSKDLRDVTSADTVLRRYYTNVLLPYLPAHTFSFGLIAYAVTQRVSFANAGFPIGDFTVTAQLFLVIASIIIPFIAFIDFPFWLGQREWKREILDALRAKLTEIKEKIEECSECHKDTRDQFECALKMHKFYQEEIDKVTKIPMHPYDFQVSLWVFVWGLISSNISLFVVSLLSPK